MKPMLQIWADNLGERLAIESFWEWATKRFQSLDYIDLPRALDEYHGINKARLEKERRALLEVERTAR